MLTQPQWNAIFNGVTTIVTALIAGGICHWMDAPWWYQALAVAFFVVK